MTNPFNRGSSPDARLPRPAARRNGEVVQFRGVLRPTRVGLIPTISYSYGFLAHIVSFIYSH